jgi:protein TonB
MTQAIFDQLLDPGWSRKRRTRGRVTLSVSIAIHAVALAALVVVPLLTLGELPELQEQALRAIFVDSTVAPPPPPPPPPPPKAMRSKAVEPETRPQERTKMAKFTAPVEVPDTVTEDPGVEFGSDLGVAGGVAEGVEGGIEGGVVGGVLGGVVGGVLGGVPGPPATPAPPPILAPQSPVRVGGQIKTPTKVRNVAPSYPDLARQSRIHGLVILEATISPSGSVEDVRVLRGIPLLNDAAVDAVRQWQYTPTLLNGVPVPVVMTVTVNFRLG